ncbi:copper resistance CopC family protein [Micromonospora sp. NPDC003816]|uniref:copper resistance CopC family protein n=1 Tax=Micromonospora sp. NPDC003816 TaxID=3364224 RepID=UPI0036A6EF09
MRRGPGLRWLAAGLLTLLALGLAGLALAAQLRPARLVTTDPPAGARLTTAPAAVTLTFNGPLDAERTHVWLIGPGGAFGATGAPRYRDNSVEVPVTVLGDGRYRVGYHAQLATGQTATGGVPFTVAAGLGAPPQATAAASPPATAPPDGSAGAGHHGGTGGTTGLALLLVPVVTGAVLLVLMARGRRDRLAGGPHGSSAGPGTGRRQRAWMLREPEDPGDRPADREPARPGG